MNTSFTVTPRFCIKMLEKVLRLYTPSLGEKPLADFLADKCDDLSFDDIRIDEVGNLIASKGSGLPRILLCGHMDTVPGKIKVGNSSHASAPWLSKNAIEESLIFTTELKKVLESGQENKKKGMLLTATVTEINGGTSHNVTPKECDVIMDIRIPVDMNCKMIEEKISTLVQEISKKRKVEAFHSILDETEPFEAPHNSPLVRAFTLGVMDVEHSRPTLIRKTGTGDMNVIGNQLNIPVVTYGPGDPHASHTIDEKVSIDEYLRGIEVLKKTLQHLKRLHDRAK